MTVREFIAALAELDPELEIVTGDTGMEQSPTVEVHGASRSKGGLLHVHFGQSLDEVRESDYLFDEGDETMEVALIS